MDLTTAVNSLGSDYVNKVSDLLTNKTNTASGTTDDSSFDSVFNAVKIYPQKHVRVSVKTCTCFSENTYVFFSKVRQTRFFYVHLRVIKELLRNYLWQRRQQQRSKIIQSRAGSQP